MVFSIGGPHGIAKFPKDCRTGFMGGPQRSFRCRKKHQPIQVPKFLGSSTSPPGSLGKVRSKDAKATPQASVLQARVLHPVPVGIGQMPLWILRSMPPQHTNHPSPKQKITEAHQGPARMQTKHLRALLCTLAPCNKPQF